MKNDNKKTGFGGLSSLVSDIDIFSLVEVKKENGTSRPVAPSVLPSSSENVSSPSNRQSTKKNSAEKIASQLSSTSAQSSSTVNTSSDTQNQKSVKDNTQKRNSFFRRFFLGLAWVSVCFIVIKIVVEISSPSYRRYTSGTSSSYSTDFSNNFQSNIAASQSSSSEPASTYFSNLSDHSYGKSLSAPTNDIATTLSSPSEPTYSRPDIGTNNILSVSEIRWCQRERIRLEHIRNYVTTDRAIKEVNSLIDDYNSRCGSYRYRNGDLSIAQQDVEIYKSDIVANALKEANELDGTSVTSSKTNSSSLDESIYSSRNTNKTNLIIQVQQLLKDLGYAPGQIDGIYGRKTKEAIISFQKNEGLIEDGIITESLLYRLKKAHISRFAY